jgi:hypothetical protein
LCPSDESRNPVIKELVPGFRRDDVWTPVFTGVTTFYKSIKYNPNMSLRGQGEELIQP